jgi:putative phage-type endonuclease
VTLAPIGGSEAAAACGLDPFKSRVRLYLEKRGEIEQREGSEAAVWGTLLQPVIAEEVERRGYVTMPAPDDAITSEAHPFMVGHPDGFCKDAADAIPPSTRGLLEIKTAGLWQNHLWLDGGTPNAYVIQVQHYMVLTGLEWALIAALIGGQRLELRVVERDEKLIGVMLQLEAEFWRMLNEGEMPSPDGSEATQEAIRRLYPEAHAGTAVNLTSKDRDLIDSYKRLNEALKETEQQRDVFKQELQLRLGDNELGLLDGAPAIRWSTVNRKGYTVEEKSYRRFSVL